MSEREINPRYRFYVRTGKAHEAPWVVVDRKRGFVAAEFETRREARSFVEECNRETDSGAAGSDTGGERP